MKRLLVFVVMCLPLWVSAQIVRVEMNPDATDTTHWQGNVDLNGSLVQNNRQLFRLATGSRVRYQKAKSRSAWLSLNDLRLTFSDNIELENRGFQHFRYQFLVDTVLTWEAFGQVQFDHLLGIQLRTLVGTGPRFNVGHEWVGRLRLGTLYMWEYEEELKNGVINRVHRGSIYVNWTRPVGKHAALAVIGYYQPNLTLLRDYRLLANGTFTLPLTRRLQFNVSGDIIYDAAPAGEVLNLSYTVLNGLGWRF